MDEGRLIIERRITQRVFNYWKQICGTRLMPEENDIDPEPLGDDWPHCFLLQVRDVEHIDQFNFTYLGEGISEAYANAGIDYDNIHMIGPNAFYLVHHFMRIMDAKVPLIDEGAFTSRNGQHIRYRQCLLPLGKGRKVEAIFGAMLFAPEVKRPVLDSGIKKTIW